MGTICLVLGNSSFLDGNNVSLKLADGKAVEQKFPPTRNQWSGVQSVTIATPAGGELRFAFVPPATVHDKR